MAISASGLSGKFTPLLRASFRRQLCCATSKDSRHSCVARLTDDENPSRINPANFPDSTLVLCQRCCYESWPKSKKLVLRLTVYDRGCPRETSKIYTHNIVVDGALVIVRQQVHRSGCLSLQKSALSIDGEAVEQAVAARPPQIVLAAASGAMRLSNRFSVIFFRACREELLHLCFPAGQVQVLPAG